MAMLEEQRETWGSRGGFVLAAVGSAVGLGNLWGFPYKLYSYGGGAFLIPYITAMFCIGIPILILEFSLGHFTQRAAPDAFATTNKRLEFVGWWGIILGFVIITYYPVILAYCFSFMFYSGQSIVTGQPLPWAGEGLEGVQNASNFFHDTYLTQGQGIWGPFHFEIGSFTMNIGPLQKNILIPLFITWFVMYLCIFKGVNLVSKIVWLTVPLPWIILLILAIRALTLEGNMQGLVYYLEPTWSELLKPTTWRYAFGQMFFSLSLAYGVMITYASFLHRKSDINNNAAIIGIADFATSFIAGIAIFATLGGMAFVTTQSGNPVQVSEVVKEGAGLAFVAFPYALAQLPAAPYWSFLFFFTLVTLGIDSAFSITESVLAGIVDKTGWPRWLVLPLISIVGLVLGFAYVTKTGIGWLGTVDGFINGTWGIAFLGLLECVVLGWFYNINILRVHANERSDWRLGIWWNYAIRIIIPIVLGTLFFWSLFDDINNPDGFLKDPEGNWIFKNCVGVIIVSLAPVIAIIFSLIRSRNGQDYAVKRKDFPNPNYMSGRAGGVIALILGLISMVSMITVIWSKIELTFQAEQYLLYQALGLSIAALLLSTYIIDKYTSNYSYPSWVARWAGILAILDISAFVALVLIRVTEKLNDTKEVAEEAPSSLGPVAFGILAVVFVSIVLGLGWCFYRAMKVATANQVEEPQRSGQ